MSSTNNKKKIAGIGIISAIIVMLSSIFIYASVVKPQKYSEYIDLGNKYLLEENYEEAILAFEKAIKIDAKSTEARVGAAKAYIGNNELDKAIEILEEAQELDKTNETLLKEILEILNEIDSDAAYEFLDRFIEEKGEDNISSDIKEILELSKDIPDGFNANPKPGKYVQPISVKLKLDKMKVGHSYYYTTDGTEPNKEAIKYRGNIDIKETTTIKVIGYNKNNESSKVINLEYIIDSNIINDVKDLVKESEELLNNTSVGTNVGQTTQESKKNFEVEIKSIKIKLKEGLQTYEDAKFIKNKITSAMKEFKDNIVKPTDKSKLKTQIETAQNLYDNSTEGNKSGQYKSGSKETLLKEINASKEIYNDPTINQSQIDTQVSKLQNAITTFKNSKVRGQKPVLSASEVNKYKQRILERINLGPDQRLVYDYDVASAIPKIHNNYHTFCIYYDDGIMSINLIIIDIVTEEIYMCNEIGEIWNI